MIINRENFGTVTLIKLYVTRDAFFNAHLIYFQSEIRLIQSVV